MRVAIVVAVVCLSTVGLSVAQDVQASIKQSTNIPAQDLGAALKTLAYERGFQLMFRADVVVAKHTHGAVGNLTTAEALTRLLEGTNLVYSYLNDKTVTILPVDSNNKLQGERPGAGISPHCSGFEPGCVEFHKTQRSVRTPSSEQVRQPIFRDSLDQWRSYEPWLEPLKAALGDAVDRYRD